MAGVAQAVGLFTQVLRQEGIGEIAVEDPGSLGVRQHLRNGNMQTPPVRSSQRGPGRRAVGQRCSRSAPDPGPSVPHRCGSRR